MKSQNINLKFPQGGSKTDEVCQSFPHCISNVTVSDNLIQSIEN